MPVTPLSAKEILAEVVYKEATDLFNLCLVILRVVSCLIVSLCNSILCNHVSVWYDVHDCFDGFLCKCGCYLRENVTSYLCVCMWDCLYVYVSV